VGEIAAEVARREATPTAAGGPSRAIAASTRVVAKANAERFPKKERQKQRKAR
jgi:hypothetical protein